MHLIKIKHYVAKSFEDKPSFVLEMSDGNTYISNGCVFARLTRGTITKLNNLYNCKQYMDELFASPSIEMTDVTDARFMFRNSKISTFDNDMPNVTDARYMFADSKLATFSSDMSSVTDVKGMFCGCRKTLNVSML